MMRLPKFDYRAPREISEAVKIIAGAGPEGQFVAGGTDLYPNMKRRQQTPKTVISVMRVPELNQISGEGKSGVTIGASVTLTDVCENPIINRDYPVVAHAARTISTPILRNMGTIGGNLLLDTRCNYYDQNYEWRKGINFCLKKDGDICWVAPGSSKCWAVQSSDLVPVMVAIGAKLRFASTLGDRVIDAAGLYNDDGIDYLHKRPDELLVDIQLPPTNGWRASYQKLRRRGAFDFPVLGVAAYVRLDEPVRTGSGPGSPSGQPAWGGGSDRVVGAARIVLGGIAPSPVVVEEAAAALIGHPLDNDHIQAAAEAAYVKARPLDNTDFVMNWRKQMTRQYTLRALNELHSK
ncbi:MAG: FAD binding domain-containing protein [Pyrinomonadaceae bacterium]|nr:FAD binding domain-containing protein [Pyrinomonadaceae bacterium]MDQ3174329.1 FAD binding domain-containing protein [Acidobacteriota bacterium]